MSNCHTIDQPKGRLLKLGYITGRLVVNAHRLQVLKIVLREPGNRKIVRKGDIATMLEHLRLQTSPAVTTESTKVLLNCCTEPINAMRLVDLDGLSNFLSMLSGSVGDEAQASVAGIIQSICLQVGHV